MKRIFTLVTCLCLLLTAKSQVLLNELYPLPNAGKHEFFELYNNSITVFPVSLSDYTIITYFEGAGNEKGFYVLDLPDLFIEPKGFFVGSSAVPFNYQGFVNSTKSDFSWNDLAFLSSHNGYLKKWVIGNAVPAAIDGNANYDEKPVPVNLNDLFFKRSGNGASYNMFIYKSGVLVNAFFGGVSNTNVPSFITNMPVMNVKIAGGPTFTIDFPHYSNIGPVSEFVNSEVGTDNGYIRTKDGYCGVWTKSSSTAFHTPGSTNGGRTGIDGSVGMFGSIERGITAADSSTVTYKVTSAPVEAFPLTLDLYVDIGGNPGEVDTTDQYLRSVTIADTSSLMEFKTKFLPANASIIIAVKTVAGCLDRVLLVTNMLVLHSDFISFTGDVNDNKAGFQWKVAQDKNLKLFEVQESGDGVHFNTIGFTTATATQGLEQYVLNTSLQVVQTRFYRVRAVYVDQSVSYSKVIKLDGDGINAGIVFKNSASSNLEFTYTSSMANNAEISIYSMTGTKVYSVRTMTQKGLNDVSINLNEGFSSGVYVLEVKSANTKTAVKFLRK